MAWKYILFDLDGTLTDSSAGILSSLQYALEVMGESVPDRSVLLQFIGPPLLDSFQNIIGMDLEEATEAAARYRERYSVIGLFENEPYEGIGLALSRLKSQEKILALATSKPESYSVRILRYFHLMKYFDVVVGSTMDGTRKKKEDVIREALRRLKLGEEEKDSVIMVGDRSYDVAGARKCGIASVGVCYGFGDAEELTEAGADFVVKDVGELMMLLADHESEEEQKEEEKGKTESIEELINTEELSDNLEEMLQMSEDTEETENTDEQEDASEEWEEKLQTPDNPEGTEITDEQENAERSLEETVQTSDDIEGTEIVDEQENAERSLEETVQMPDAPEDTEIADGQEDAERSLEETVQMPDDIEDTEIADEQEDAERSLEETVQMPDDIEDTEIADDKEDASGEWEKELQTSDDSEEAEIADGQEDAERSLEETVQTSDDIEETEIATGEGGQKLSEIAYQRVDFEKAGRELQNFFERLRDAKSAEEQFEIHQEYYRLKDHIDTMSSLAAFRHAADTTDPFYDGENDYYDENLPIFQNQVMAYQNALFHSPYRTELEKMLGAVAFRNMELQIKSVHPKLISLQQEENRLVSEYEKLLASASFIWENDILSMAGLGRYLTDADRGVRQKAWGMFQDFMELHEDAWDDLYDQLVNNRHRQAEAMGYQDFVTLGYYRMRRNCYGREEVHSFRQQVKKDLIPFVTRLQEKRRQRLGVDQLQVYDNGVYFSEGNPVPEGTPQQILENGRIMYSAMSPETAEFMKKMMEQELFDVLGRPGKRQGGFMDFLPEIGMPVVFANFNGTCADVDVITHECGHAFQGYLAAAHTIREHRDITMETAEVHSMSMEFFADPWMDLFFGENAPKFCQMQLEDAICFIPYGCMVDEFQEIIYEYPQLSRQERHEVWKRLEKQYRPHLHFDGLSFFQKGGWWQRQPHIYSSPFYYIDYCLAQVCALQYKILMERDQQAAWRSYLKFCRLSAKDNFIDLLQEAGLLNPFQEGFIKKLVHQLEKLVEY